MSLILPSDFEEHENVSRDGSQRIKTAEYFFDEIDTSVFMVGLRERQFILDITMEGESILDPMTDKRKSSVESLIIDSWISHMCAQGYGPAEARNLALRVGL